MSDVFEIVAADRVAEWPDIGQGTDEAAAVVHPRVTVGAVEAARRHRGHVIVFANEKGGVGKSTMAFHCCVALAEAGHAVVAIDLDARQQSLATALDNRCGTARCLGVDLPRPRYAALRQPYGRQLVQEIRRLGPMCDFVVIDVAGHDSPVARHAIAMADTLVSPVNCSFVDLDLLGRVDPVSLAMRKTGHFAELVSALRAERERLGMPPMDWVIARNRQRAAERRQQQRIDGALAALAPELDFRVAAGLAERVIYRELFPFGLSQMDLERIPGLGRLEMRIDGEIDRLVADLRLPLPAVSRKAAERPASAKVLKDRAEAFSASLRAHLHPEVV